ncbi:hypothetical protein AB0I53_06890 [Saccharopolyspora sp. NPDC050389]|uniref:hypothetical protein n=1 Tax=Saccharopolyspora sp. NPDC050389 TaxID=3155516 RepID=UPI0033EC4ACA
MTGTEIASRRAKAIAAPDDVRSRASLRNPDYQDAFVVDTGDEAPQDAERWIRDVFESAPAPVRAFLRIGWSMFGAQLGPAKSTAHVLGWQIGENRSDWIRLEVFWKVGLRANLVLRAQSSSVVLATFVEHQRRAARILWPALIPVHRLTLRYLLSRAARCHP